MSDYRRLKVAILTDQDDPNSWTLCWINTELIRNIDVLNQDETDTYADILFIDNTRIRAIVRDKNQTELIANESFGMWIPSNTIVITSSGNAYDNGRSCPYGTAEGYRYALVPIYSDVESDLGLTLTGGELRPLGTPFTYVWLNLMQIKYVLIPRGIPNTVPLGFVDVYVIGGQRFRCEFGRSSFSSGMSASELQDEFNNFQLRVVKQIMYPDGTLTEYPGYKSPILA